MKNLTKENYWDDVRVCYPDALKLFCNWIDKYKEEIGWKELFGDKLKFHDMPFEFQNGVIARFDIECFNGVFTGKGKAVYEGNRDLYLAGFEKLFNDLQNMLQKQKQ